MPYRSLADFLEELEQEGQLVRISDEVNAALAIAARSADEARAGGNALVFQNVRGKQGAVVTQLLGDEARLCRALGVASLAEAVERVNEFVGPTQGRGWLQRLTLIGEAAERWQPKLVKTAACQQVVKLAGDVDLGQLPLLTCWPYDAAPSISAAPIYTQPPVGEQRSVAGYDLQLVDRGRLAIVWQANQRAAQHHAQYRQRGEPMPVAIALGGDPTNALIAASPLTAELDGLAWCGMVRGRPVEVVKCRTIDLRVPADADLVIEGHVLPDDPPIVCGPLGTATGYYSLQANGVAMQVTAVTQRVNPIYPALVPGLPQGEQQVLRRAIERLFLPLARQMIPELVDYCLPGYGGPEGFAFLSIRKTYPGQAHKVAQTCWGWEPLMFCKFLVVVDAEIDVNNAAAVWAEVAANVSPGRDVLTVKGPVGVWDHAAPAAMLGEKMALDATSKLPAEHPRPWPKKLRYS